jgi:hypothetical protein
METEKKPGVFGNFLQEMNKDLYGSKVEQIEFTEMSSGGMRIEWACVGDDLKIHIFKRGKWPLTYAKDLYALMDKHAAGEERDIGYETLVDSWYIVSKSYSSGKLNPEISAEKLCQNLLNDLSS